MSDIEPWTRQLLSVIVSQLCKTIGWHSISTTCLQILVDILHRYLKQLGTNIHDYTEHYNHSFPALEELHLALVDMGINIEDLKEYVDYVSPIPIKQKVPKYPLEKKSNLNFLKPGSREVVTRPVYIHEHLPAMYPELSDENYASHEPISNDESTLPNLSSVGATSSTFKKSGGNEVINNKHITRLISEEIGRPLRELSCVMMTTSGFLSPAREGKAPEARLPKLPIQNSNQAIKPTVQPAAPPPEVKSDHKKIGHSKANSSAKSIERSRIREDHQNGKELIDDSKIKKLAGMKEMSKLKAFKPVVNKPFENLDSMKIIKPEKIKLNVPFSPKEPKMPKPDKTNEKIPAPEIVEEKLATEPNKLKLNIFKRISKVKEDRAESPVLKTNAEKNAQINECIEAVIKRSREKDEYMKVLAHEKISKAAADSIYVNEVQKSVELLPTVKLTKHIKRKKKQKLYEFELNSKKLKTNHQANEIDVVEKPKPTEPEPPPCSFFTQLQTTPGLMPPSLSSNLLIPRFPNPFMNFTKADPNGPHPEMPNLPLPPPTLMQANVDNHQKQIVKTQEVEKKIVNNNNAMVSDKKLKKKMKKDKREKDKKKRDKKNKLKNKEKIDKKKDLKKIKVKNKEKAKKKQKLLNSQKEETNEDTSVPKLKLKIASSNSPQLSPSGIPSPKIVIKPIVKHDEPPNCPLVNHQPVKEEKQPSPELAKISAFISKPIKQKTAPKVNSEMPASVPKPVVEPTTLTISTKISKKGTTSLEIKPKNKEKQNKTKKNEDAKPKPTPYYYDAEGNQVWVCPSCGAQDDGSPMIGCDGCDAWYHWVCVGIKSAPDSAKWFCVSCAKT